MRHRIRWIPDGSIPRDPNLTIRLQSNERALRDLGAEVLTDDEDDEVVVEPPVEELTIGAGADAFADATEITYEIFRDIVAAYTYSKTFTSELNEPDCGDAEPHRTAWWKVLVPADKVAWLTLDAQLSFGDNKNPDIHFTVYYAQNWPAAIAELVQLNAHEDVDDNDGGADSGIDAHNNGWYPRLDNVQMDGSLSGDPQGTLFYVQVGQFGGDSPGVCYVMRYSITETEPGTTPADGVDPDA